jgi:hypothetical protein
MEADPANQRDTASLSRRLAFAGHSYYLFDNFFCRQPLAKVSRIGDQQTARIPDHLARIGYDLLECLKTRKRVPDIGNVELSLLNARQPLPQHPRYLSYWHDPSLNTTVGMIVGIDLIRHEGKYYVIELNHGPSIYPRRRELYDLPFDPIVSTLMESARAQGMTSVVPIAFRWHPIYVEELARAAAEYGIAVTPYDCPLRHSTSPRRIFGLPRPLAEKTLYVIHSGLFTPAFRYLDNKWYTSKWLRDAIANELPPDTLVALPETHDQFTFPLPEHGPRWPNMIIKLAASARSCHVIAARFEDEADARATLGIAGDRDIPQPLRSGFLNGLLFYGSEHVIYQAYVPPELDERGHAQMIRLHVFVSPQETLYLSSHVRTSRRPVPERVQRGIIREDDAIVFNNADYRHITPEMEPELRSVAAHLGQSMQRAIARKFEYSAAL